MPINVTNPTQTVIIEVATVVGPKGDKGDPGNGTGTSTPAPVQSVQGKIGAVVLTPSDIGAADATHTHPIATATVDGLLSKTDKVKLDGLSNSPVINPVTTTVNGLMLSTDKTKLDGIAVNATANSSDTILKDRANHTGVQAISTVTGLQTALDTKYVKATNGIPKTDLDTAVQTSIAKADTALQDIAGLQNAFTAGTAAQQAAFQSSVSGAVALSATDAAANSAAILAAAAAGKKIDLPIGSFPISPISTALDLIFTGASAKQSILYSVADAPGFLIKSTGRIEMRRMGLRGANNVAKGRFTAQVGSQSGVQIDARNGSSISDGCEIYGFDSYGVGLIGNMAAAGKGPAIIGNFIFNNWIGIDTGSGDNLNGLGEYAKIVGNTISENAYGAIIRTGNIDTSANSFQFNGESLYIMGGASNGAHGITAGNMLNHAYRVTIRLENIVYGQIVANNTMFSNTAEIIMSGCRGVQFNANLIFAGLLTFSGPMWNSFADNVFHGAMPTINDTSGTKWKDNYSLVNNAYVGNKFSATVDSSFSYLPGGDVLGINLVSNGDFTSSAGWTQQAGWEIISGVASATAATTYLFTGLSGGNAQNATYTVDFDLTCTSGWVSIGIGGNVVSSNRYASNGHVTMTVNPGPGNNNNVLYFVGNVFTGTIDNVTVRRNTSVGADMSVPRSGATEYLYVGATKYFSGAGSPEGVVTAAVGSEYTRTDGTAGTPAAPGTLKYVKTSGVGAAGWAAVL